MRSKKLFWICAEPIEFFHGHAGVTGPSSVSKALPNLKMQVIRCAEIGSLQLGLVEEASEGGVFVNPISDFHPNTFNMGIDRIEKFLIRQIVFDDDGLVRGSPEDADNPSAADRINGFVKPSFQIESGMVVSWPIAPPEFSVDADDAILKHPEIFPVGFWER